MQTAARQRQARSIVAHPRECTGCLICELRCSLRFVKEFNASRSAIHVRRLVGTEHEFALAFTDLCDDCGICARFCPYGALEFSKGKP